MTKKTDNNSNAQVFVYGLDESGKSKGARFPASEAEKVSPVIAAMKFQMSQSDSEHIVSLGMKLPAGRIYARGKAFIPNIKRDLYDKLLAAAAGAASDEKAGPGDKERPLEEAPTDRLPQAPAVLETGILPPLASGLPRNWESIAAGNMVLAQESPSEGWWECLIVARNDEIVTLRYRDYPKAPKFDRHISTIALINPRPA